MQGSAELPVCAICFELLGRHGGPVTLPCGHNGCRDCLKVCQSRNPQCPLCRAPFDPEVPLRENNELRDLVNLATSCLTMDEATRKEGWEAFPTAKDTTSHYVSDLAHCKRDVRRAARPSAPSAPDVEAEHASDAPASPGAGASPGGDLLALDPPPWLPDSYASHCGACALPFKALLRLRHHCRLCGKIYCHACTSKRRLLPPKFGCREPQRVCELCAALVEPLQGYLVGALAASAQPPVHDAVDAIALRSWLNLPWSGGLGDDVYKAANIVACFAEAARLDRERTLPGQLLAGAQGLALMSVLRVGAGWSAAVGTGVVVARRADGSWSAPCAAVMYGVGWGLQLGGELTDLLVALRTPEAVHAFCGSVHVVAGGSASLALGLVGRAAEAAVHVGPAGSAAAVSYSCSKGAFVGASLDGAVVRIRDAANHNFYGFPVTARQLLLEDAIPQPPAAAVLYEQLAALMTKHENRGWLVHDAHAAAAAAARRAARTSTGADPGRAAEEAAPAGGGTERLCVSPAAVRADAWRAPAREPTSPVRRGQAHSDDEEEEPFALPDLF